MLANNKLFVLVLLGALSACGGGANENPDPMPTPDKTPEPAPDPAPTLPSVRGIVSSLDIEGAQVPVRGGEVQVLTSAGEATSLSATTTSSGAFSIEIADASSFEHEFLSVSVSADGIRTEIVPVELDVDNSIDVQQKNSYSYEAPVQLDDGIVVGHLDNSEFDAAVIESLLARTMLEVDAGTHVSNSTTAFPSGYTELHSLLIYKDGALIVEEYFKGNNDYIDFENNITRMEGTPSDERWDVTDKHYIASVNKSLTSTVTGIAFEQYGVVPTDTVAPHLPEKAAYFDDENKAALTFHDVLTMQLGFTWEEWSSNDLALLWQSTDFTDFLLSRNNAGPQSSWVYNSAGPNMLLRGLDNLVSGTVRDWADENFYSRLGINDYDWQSQPDGLPEGSARMYMRPRDMLKVGITYLNDGMWNGEQVIPSAWVEEVSKVQVNGFAGDYSYLFWMRNLGGISYISADGDGGQYINIFPEQNMVIVMTQGHYLSWPLYVNQANEIMEDFIFEALETP